MSSENIQNENAATQDQSYAIKFINPEAVVSKLGLEPGIVVADFGCGSGYFSLPVARKIGEQGVVYSFDILPQCLESIESQAKAAGITNIVAKRANLEKQGGSKLPDSSCDWVIMKDMLFQNKDKSVILAEAGRVLKDSGKILLIEWNSSADSSIGPDRSLRIAKEALVEIIQKSGLGVFKEIPVSDFHYGLILIK